MMMSAVCGALWLLTAVQDRGLLEDLPGDLAQSPPENPPAQEARERRTPDLVLLRVRGNFLEHDLRVNATYENDIQRSTAHAATDLEFRLAVPLDTVWMIGLLGNYRWEDELSRPDENGAALTVFGRVQLLDLPESSYAFNVEVATPNKGVDNTKTQVGFGVAGFEDLDLLLGLDRVGLYADLNLQHSSGRGAGDGENQLSYVLSMAKTWTEDLLGAGRFTIFGELGGTTQLNQGSDGRTVITGTPGLRLDPAPAHALIAGVDFPITHPHGFGELFRISYVYSF